MGKQLKPKVVVMCGSSKFCDVMAVCAWLIEKEEQAITMGLHLLPQWYAKDLPDDHLAEYEGVADQMDRLHLRKIDMADEVFIVNCKDYIGDSTKLELSYALELGLKIRWFTSDEIGEKVLDIIRKKIQSEDTE